MKHHQELHERIRALEAPAALRDSYGHDVRLHERIRALEARVAELKEASCDYCGHKFYALETDEKDA